MRGSRAAPDGMTPVPKSPRARREGACGRVRPAPTFLGGADEAIG